MAARRRTDGPEPRQSRPATTPEVRENQLIALAVDLVEKKLLDGTASSQEVTHFLKLGSSREKLEQERLRGEVEINRAKREMFESQKRVEELYGKALNAMRSYAGQDPLEQEEFDEY